MKIANFADSSGSRWHIYNHPDQQSTCNCGTHSTHLLNKDRITQNVDNLDEAQKFVETKFGDLHGTCTHQTKKILEQDQETEADTR